MTALSKRASLDAAEKAIGVIRENDGEVTTPSFELWFTHFSGVNPGLSDALEKALTERGALDDAALQSLHAEFLGGAGPSDKIAALTTAICDRVSAVGDAMAGRSEDYRSYSDALADALSRFDDASQKGEMKPLVSALTDATRVMATKNAELRQQLSDADEELSTMRENIRSIQSEALTDGLTGVANRKHFDQFMDETLKACAEAELPSCLVIGDVDHFKSFNDQWGHQVGDTVLKLVAGILSANVKGRDLVARYGGEEFAIILPDTTLPDSVKLADRLRAEIAKRRLTKRHTNETIGHVTISFGVAQLRPGEDAGAAIERADRALYRAKDTGRNRVVGETELES